MLFSAMFLGDGLCMNRKRGTGRGIGGFTQIVTAWLCLGLGMKSSHHNLIQAISKCK